MRLFDVVLLEKESASGLEKSEVMDLFDLLSGKEGYPLEVQARSVESCAMGFIIPQAAEKLDYDYEKSGLYDYIADILDNMEKESPDCSYEYQGIRIWISRAFEKNPASAAFISV